MGAGIEGPANPAVTPSFACFRGVGLQQDACFGQQPGRMFAHMCQRVEPLSLLIAELHHVPLHGTLFRGHDASPSLRSHRFGDSPQDQGRGVLAFFCDSNIDWPIAAVPTCVGPDEPPKYPTTYYTDYMIRYQQRSYNVFDSEKRDAAE